MATPRYTVVLPIRITRTMLERLKDLAAERELRVSEMIRDMLKTFIDVESDEMPPADAER